MTPTSPEIDRLICESRSSLERADYSSAVSTCTRLSLAYYYLSETRRPLDLSRDLAKIDLPPDDQARILAAQARIIARVPLDIGADTAAPDTDAGLPFWMPRERESQELATEARRLCGPETGPLTHDVVEGTWRSVHRSPSFRRDEWQPPTPRYVRVASLLGDDLSLDISVDQLMWNAVDALECGHRFEYDRYVQEARALTALGALNHLQWWVRSTLVTRAIHEGLPAEAMTQADAAATFARENGILGGPSVLSVQRWYLDELRDDHAFGVEVGLSTSRRIDHPLTVACPALSMTRAGLIPLAVPWAVWLTEYLSTGSEESSWLAVITIAGELACLLIEAEQPAGFELAQAVAPHLDRFRHRISIDTRAVLSMGPVARTAADVALALGDIESARALVDDADQMIARMGEPVISRAELAITRARLALVTHEDSNEALSLASQLVSAPGLDRLRSEVRQLAADVALTAAPSVLTAREIQVLALLAKGRSNPNIAAELAYSRATIAKDVRRLYTKLAARNREELAAIGQSSNALALELDSKPALTDLRVHDDTTSG